MVEEDELERRLILIWIGTWKLRENKPKYRRVQKTWKEWNETNKATTEGMEAEGPTPNIRSAIVKDNKRKVQGVKEQGWVHIKD